MDKHAIVVTFAIVAMTSVIASGQENWKLKPINPFKKKPDYVEPIELTDESPKFSLFPKRPLGESTPRPVRLKQPEFIKRWNDSSKRFWSNARSEMSEWEPAASLRDATSETWDTITGKMPKSYWKPSWNKPVWERPSWLRLSPPESQSPPKIRTVNDWLAKPSRRF